MSSSPVHKTILSMAPVGMAPAGRAPASCSLVRNKMRAHEVSGCSVTDTGFEKGGSRKVASASRCFNHAPFWLIIYGIKWQSLNA